MKHPTTHTSEEAGRTQCERILDRLLAAAGEWVGLPELATASGSMAVHSRIADLRHRGHTVEQKTENQGRMKHSYYRIP